MLFLVLFAQLIVGDPRHRATVIEFEKLTGYPHGRPGFVVDHILPLCAGGADAVSNMQWQPVKGQVRAGAVRGDEETGLRPRESRHAVSDFEDAVKRGGLSVCPKCGEQPPQVEAIGRGWYCQTCSASWPMDVSLSRPTETITTVPTMTGPIQNGTMWNHPKVLP